MIHIFEGSLFSELYEQFVRPSMVTIMKANFHESIKSIVDDCVKVDNLALDYFNELLRGLFAVYFTFFIIFILHIALKFFLRSKRWFRFAFKRYRFEFNLRLTFRCPNVTCRE